MATKTFEELKQMAIQIRDEKTNKQNTATRIGTQMLEHLNKLEQEYYNKENIDEQKEQTDVKFSELGNKIMNCSTLVSPSIEYHNKVICVREFELFIGDENSIYRLSVLGFFSTFNQVIIGVLDYNSKQEIFRIIENVSSIPQGIKEYYYDDNSIYCKVVIDWSLYTYSITDSEGNILIFSKKYTSPVKHLLNNELIPKDESYDKIATILGLTITGVKSNIYRKIDPIIDVKLWAKDGVGIFAFTNMGTRVSGETFWTINDKEKNEEIFRLAVTEDEPSGIKTYEKYDDDKKIGFRIIYDWDKTVPGSTGSDGNMQLEIMAQPYTSKERLMYNGKFVTTSETITEIVATRNAQNYNSIRELMKSLPASYNNRYRIIIPKGRWYENDIQGNPYIELVGEDMYETILYNTGTNTDKKTPLDYSFSDYSNKAINEVPQQFKHIIFAMNDINISNVTLEGNNIKYCVHMDYGKPDMKVNITNCCIKDNGFMNFSIGVGIHGGQGLFIEGCKIIKKYEGNGRNLSGIVIHNWNNEKKDSIVNITNTKFVNCDYLYLSELCSGRNDIINLINCYSDKENASVQIEVANTSDGTTYYTKEGTSEKETNPLKVPYSFKLNCLSSEVKKIKWFKYLGSPEYLDNPRPEFISRSITALDVMEEFVE